MRRTILPLLLTATACSATTYEIGPGKPYTSIGAAPWAILQPGDTVLIHWRSTPYEEKWLICRAGTVSAPITARGVPNSSGTLPVIDGNGAVTPRSLNYWNEERSVLKIGGANKPPDTTPKHIVVENLEIRSGRQPYKFTNDNGSASSYSKNAAAVFIEKGENITIRNCVLRDSGNGLFVANGGPTPTRNIVVERNYIHGNGNVNSIYEHNSYTEALSITFQFNRYGPLLAGAQGNNLKDRSAGTLVRYNWIEGGNRQLDLVDSSHAVLRSDPSYAQAHVYGNVLIEPAGDGNRQVVHYGGDSGNTAAYRRGTLYFYNDTVVSKRTDRTTLFRLSTNSERADVRNNVFHTVAGGNTVSMFDQYGTLDLSHNWLKPGWVKTFGTLSGAVNNDGTQVQSAAPGFVNESAADYHLAAGSVCLEKGGLLHPAVLPAYDVVQQYVNHQKSEPRPASGLIDIGAFERK